MSQIGRFESSGQKHTVNAEGREVLPRALSHLLPYAGKVVLLAAAYFAAAKLALLAAIPPGYATAVWPPSGIALAAVLLLGNRVWPGVWLGAALVNLTVQSSLAAALLMGTGHTLAITYTIFGDGLAASLPSLPLTFAIPPFVIWAALRFRQREVATVNVFVCAIAVWFTLDGRGPFASAPLNTSLLLLLAFMSTVVTTGLVLSAVVGERARAIEALKRALQNLKEETIRDPLTGLYNRRFLGDYLPRELIRARRERGRVALIMIDLDRFKQVNDTAGHAAGDLVLMEIATLLKRHIRGSDIACRYGGEEFTLVLPKATPESAHRKAEAICSAIREDRDRLLEVTASLGVAFFPDHAADAESSLRAADEALYEAKRKGRNRVKIFADAAAKPAATRVAGVKYARS